MGKTQRKRRPAEQSLTPFLDPLQALQNLLSAFGGRGVIVGGIAASLLGKPRFTADVDAVLLLEFETDLTGWLFCDTLRAVYHI